MKWMDRFCHKCICEQDSPSLLEKACFSSVTEPATQYFKGKFIWKTYVKTFTDIIYMKTRKVAYSIAS